MSKMRSANSAFALLAAAAILVCAGCAPNVHSASVRGTGYVRLDDVVKHHPLYPQLSQLDDAIASINLRYTGRQVPLGAQQMAAQTAELNRELRDAQVRANKILAQKQHDYERRESQAVQAALQAAGVHGQGGLAAEQMSNQSALQAQQAASAANADYQAFQQNVVAQDNAASSSVMRQLQAQAEQKYRAKAEQLQQNETDLSLRLTQQDATARLAIKMRLSNLAMDPDARKQAVSQLAAINAKEAGEVAAQRSADAATLRAYRAQLDKETGTAMRSQVGAIQSQTQAKLEEHRNEVSSQIRSLGPAATPPNLSPGVQAQIAQIHRQFVGRFQSDAKKTIQEYNET